RRIQALALAIAEDLGVTGMLAGELFETAGGEVLVNELAMRPHNTGHWSMDGAVTGQFEQHLRAVADLPLGATAPRGRAAVMVNLLGGAADDLAPGAHAALAADPELRIHLYGKAVRPGRKIGHVTLVGDDAEDLLARAHRAAGPPLRQGRAPRPEDRPRPPGGRRRRGPARPRAPRRAPDHRRAGDARRPHRHRSDPMTPTTPQPAAQSPAPETARPLVGIV